MEGQYFVLSGPGTLDMNFPSLPMGFLPKSLSMELQNALFTVMTFHPALILIKKLDEQQVKYRMGSFSWNSLILPCFPSS